MTKPQHKKYVFLAGGHSGGPLAPLLAVAAEWQAQDKDITPVVLDVKDSVAEKHRVNEKFIFHRISAGKLRRYWSWKNLLIPFQFILGVLQTFWLLVRYRPLAVLGAGGFVQLPVVIAAWLRRVPRFIHQQDVRPTLSNSLSALFANMITVTFETSIRDFPQGTGLGKKYVTTNKVIWTGNPAPNIHQEKISKATALKEFGLHHELPVLLVIGGATGAAGLNQLVTAELAALTKIVQVLHSTGAGKLTVAATHNYHPHEYIDNTEAAYSAADIVLSRAGLGGITLLAHHKKPAIIVPMPKSHQEDNAQLLYRSKAAIVLDQSETTPEKLREVIRDLLFKPDHVKQLTQNMHQLLPLHSAHKVVQTITQYLEEHDAN
jgi:UDP-N-acetylglucosamine--N-acetylmuramyl-(pentapeptide) pyrophosphoryl-undecaprenol N-acetylglucosamine transferase